MGDKSLQSMRSRFRDGVLIEAARAGLVATFLLAVVILVPDAGRPIGQSFFSVAMASSWRDPGDLAAAWCSVKIVLLSVSLIFMTDCVSKVMEALRKEALAVTASFTGLIPFMGLFVGIYELVKALL
jgi:hypothetical protein